MDTLTRYEAHELVDAAEQLGALAMLAAHWDIPGHWNEHAVWDVGAIHDYVDEMCMSDESRANGPHGDDDSGLTACDMLVDRAMRVLIACEVSGVVRDTLCDDPMADAPVRPHAAPDMRAALKAGVRS